MGQKKAVVLTSVVVGITRKLRNVGDFCGGTIFVSLNVKYKRHK
jgi:hypothetical protein